MSCCCVNKYPFCTMIACKDDGINFDPVTAPIDGEYKLQLHFLGGLLEISATFTAGDVLKFPSHALNERFEYEGNIFDPNGDKLLFSVGDDETLFDCFEFNMKPSYNLSL